MPIPIASVGMAIESVEHFVDQRWIMAYAAALDDCRPQYQDTTRADGIVAHPIFAVCPEWPVIVGSRSAYERLGVTRAEVATGVHVGHSVDIARLIRPGDSLTTSMDIVGLVSTAAGALSSARLRTVDAAGETVATSTYTIVHLGVAVEGSDQPDPEAPPAIEADRVGEPVEVKVQLASGAAHVYTECARIWNPIHTDRAVARTAGLPDTILHGTASLAHGVTAALDARADVQPELVQRVSCRFSAMVFMPSTLTIRIWPPTEAGVGKRAVPFDVLNADGVPGVADGVVVVGG